MRIPYFREIILSELLISQIQLSSLIADFRLKGYTIMPDYIHLLIR